MKKVCTLGEWFNSATSLRPKKIYILTPDGYEKILFVTSDPWGNHFAIATKKHGMWAPSSTPLYVKEQS